MPRATTPTLMLLALAAALPLSALAARTFAVANDRFEKDGEPFTIFSGSFHYHRALASTWPDRLARIAAMGLNTIQTYVPWNYHELTRRHGDNATFDFTGDRDLGAFIDAAAAAGLLVLLRSGPYICGEHDLGGLPPFLLDTPGIASDADLRTNNSVYLSFVDRWYAQLLPVLKPRLYSNGGNIVLVQIENEYGSYGNTGGNPNDLAYMEHLRDLVRAGLGGRDAFQMYTTDGGDVGYLSHGAVPDVFATGDGGCGDTCDDFFAAEDQFNPPGSRAHTDSEYYTGWLTHWSEGMANTSTTGTIGGVATLLASGSSYDLYMAFGGTNWGFHNGANGGGASFQPVITSYDYDSPISEGGIHGYGPGDGDKFQGFRQLNAYWRNASLPADPPAPAVAAYGAVAMSSAAPLFANLDVLAAAGALTGQAAPARMETYGQRHGYVLYRAAVPAGAGGDTVVQLQGLADRAEVFVGLASAGVTYRPEKGAGSVTVPAGMIVPGAVLDILVENMGHINYGRGFFDPKGLTGATFGGNALAGNWSVYNLEMAFSEVANAAFGPLPAPVGPAFFRGSLAVSGAPADTYISLCGWNKGFVLINGFNIGRYWETAGPQHAFYVPASLLKTGANDIVVFEQHAPAANVSVSFGAVPDFTGAVCGLSHAPAAPAKESSSSPSPSSSSLSSPPAPLRPLGACAAPAAGLAVTLQDCAATPAANVGFSLAAAGPPEARAGALQLGSSGLCVAADLSQGTKPLVLAPCAAGLADRSQHFLWFETIGANPQPPSAFMALGALPNAVGQCIDVTGGGGAPGQAVGLYGCTGGSNQAWSVAANSSAASAIASAASGLCLAAC